MASYCPILLAIDKNSTCCQHGVCQSLMYCQQRCRDIVTPARRIVPSGDAVTSLRPPGDLVPSRDAVTSLRHQASSSYLPARLLADRRPAVRQGRRKTHACLVKPLQVGGKLRTSGRQLWDADWTDA